MTTTDKPWTAARIEAIARVIDPWAFKELAGYDAVVLECEKEEAILQARDIVAADPLEPIAAALYEALENITSRFHRALIATGSHPEYADAACAKARAAIALADGEGG